MNENFPIIDCDVHQTYQHHNELVPYMDEPFKSRLAERGFGYPGGMYYSVVGGVRKDSFPESGGTPGSDYQLMRKQLLDHYNIKYAVLNGGAMLGVTLMTEQDYPAMLAKAYNDWLLETWIKYDDRFIGSMMIAAQNPLAAAEEIRRVGTHKRICQVIVSGVTPMPIGQRYFHPIFEACSDVGIPISFHPGGNQSSGTAPVPTPVGFPQYYLEWHTLLANVYMSQLTSMVVEGVFEKYPKLKAVFIEGGISWLPALMWRLDKNYKALRQQTPWLKRLPSEYILNHCKFTTQPIEEPPKKKYLVEIFEMVNAEKTVMFSSDYPHWDFDDPYYIIRGMDNNLKERVLYKNAAELYGLEI